MSPRIEPADLEHARRLRELAIAALGPLSVGEVTDLLADRTPWNLIYCHAIAHALAPTAWCKRPQCQHQPVIRCEPAGRLTTADQIRELFGMREV